MNICIEMGVSVVNCALTNLTYEHQISMLHHCISFLQVETQCVRSLSISDFCWWMANQQKKRSTTHCMEPGSSVTVVFDYGLDDQGSFYYPLYVPTYLQWRDSIAERGRDYSFFHTTILALGPTYWVHGGGGAISPCVKQWEHETDHFAPVPKLKCMEPNIRSPMRHGVLA
jgi:hypothetical protein